MTETELIAKGKRYQDMLIQRATCGELKAMAALVMLNTPLGAIAALQAPSIDKLIETTEKMFRLKYNVMGNITEEDIKKAMKI